MTLKQRNDEIAKILSAQTLQNTHSRATARKALIESGIYTTKGKIRAEYGGEPTKKTQAA